MEILLEYPQLVVKLNLTATYNENILVNAMAIGHANKNKIFYSKAKGLNKSVVYVGSKTGRDGIHGATMASSNLTIIPRKKNQLFK